MTISVYSSIMPGKPDEVYHDFGLTVEDWIKQKTPNYIAGDDQPVSCAINGKVIPPSEWASVSIEQGNNVEFRVVPKGDVVNGLGIIFPVTFGPIAGPAFAIEQFLLDIPGQQQQGGGTQGSRLQPADARANTARLGQAVPEIFGEYIRYPDYLCQPRNYYLDETTQVLNLFLCIGVGEYTIDTSKVKIGETLIDDIASASYEIFAPGADVSGNEAHENWYPSSEVGATTGGSGIRLKSYTFDERTYFGSATASADVLSGIVSQDSWTAGITGSIKLTQSITVTDGGGSADTFTGNFQHLVAGNTVDVESDVNVNGTYVITTINGAETEITLETTGGSPITDATPGSGTMSIDKSSTQYEMLSTSGGTQITVERQLSGGGADADWDSELPQGSLTIEIEWDAVSFPPTESGPFLACPEGETTDEVEVDIFAPQGLGTVDGESILNRTRTVRIEWRELGGTTWTVQDETVSGNTRDQLGFTFTINLPSSITPEVRVSRIGDESVAVTSLDRLDFSALRSKLTAPTSYADVTTMAVTITGSDEIANQSSNRVNVEAKRKIPEITAGVLGANVETRKISAAAVRVAKSLGYEDSEIDLDELERLETIWTSRGDTFDFVFGNTTAKEAIDSILRAGFAEFTIETGLIKPVRDEPRTVFEQGYSPENMTSPLQRTFTAKQAEESDGVEVEYVKAGTWTTETVNAFLTGDNGIKLDKIKLDGVTDETRAWRIGMRRRRAQKYRRWTYSFDTELDALNSEYLSYVPLLDDIPGYGAVSILQSISADRIVVSEPLVFEAGKTHVIAYRDENGNTQGPYTATEGPDQYTALVTIPEPWPVVNPSNREPTHVYFGTTERWHFPALIKEISPNDPLSVSVTASNYDARVYSDDDNSPA